MPAGRSSSRTATAGTAAAGLVATGGRQRPGRRAGWRRPAVRWGGLAAVVLLTTVAAAYAMTGRGGSDAPASPTVGADLHTVAVIGDSVYLGGHEAVVVSSDGGRAWRRVRSLDGADAMGWAVTAGAVWVGGHPGLYRSTDAGATFTSVTGAARVDDVHALGAAAGTLYLASPRAGLLASTDGGRSWQARNSAAGRTVMGTVLVDPGDPARLVAADMASGVVASTDGGRTFTALGGPRGAMAAAWNPTNIEEILAVGMGGGARSTDGGVTWRPLPVPSGVSAISYDPTGATVYAGALDGRQARLYRSSDGGATWSETAGTPAG